MSKKSDKLKTQLTITTVFISFKHVDGQCVMHSKSDNIDIMTHDEADKELFE